MLIVGFDCATHSLGVTILKYNQNWQSDLNFIYAEFNKLKKSKLTPDIKITAINKQIKQVQNVINTIFEPLYINAFNLFPEFVNDVKKGKKEKKSIKGKKEKPKIDSVLKSCRLKGILHYLDNVILKLNQALNLVLIEYQMGMNHKSSYISSNLIYHYSTVDLSFESFNPIHKISSNLQYEKSHISVKIIGPSLKNTIAFSCAGKHINFIKKYTNTYIANKAHTKYNLKKFLEKFNLSCLIQDLNTEYLDDAADSFMMIMAHLLILNKIY
jgi:hypothetical protein